MRRYRVQMQVAVVVRAADEEHAIGAALENVHDSTILHIVDVEEYDDRPSQRGARINSRSNGLE